VPRREILGSPYPRPCIELTDIWRRMTYSPPEY
jgi:hypothetical protein